ncbi:unnamed protein product [Ostreobium quekettii]|uniref:Uncharacterized protein n=1 Tax=Ostreobium quekettii TaxID=121088 RepID=A0A8S1IXQ8_9CHLO|nr:unnamed protein product [Ostreobium quekettii]
MPMTLATANYALLAAVYGLAMLTSRQGLRNRWHNYAGIALLDVAATYLTILALQYTTVTSYALITASNLFIVVPLSRWLLRARYSPTHAAGVLLSLAGVLVLFLADRSPAPDARTADLVFGDAMLLTGSALYGLNAVWEEYILKEDAPAKELLAMLGAFGALFGGVATLLLGELWSGPTGAKHADWLRSGVVAAMFAFYSLMPAVLAWSGAAVLQMSLLASNFWAVIARLIFFDGFGGGSIWWFLVAWGLVCVGVGTYTRAGDPYRGSEGRQYARLGREEDGGGSSAPGGLELTSSGEEAWRTTGGNESGDEENGSGQAQRRGRTPAA